MTADYKKKTLQASLYVVIGFGLSNFLRLFGNLILTRLLVPELFGIVAIGYVVMIGLSLFSDIGLAPVIIRSNRSDDEVFLNTAWTLQVLRGIILAVILVAISYPVSVFYKEPLLFKILPFIAISSVLNGFTSTSIILRNKELDQKTIVLLEIAAQTVGLIFMILVGYFTRTIWALLIQGLLSELVKVYWSHKINTLTRHKFVLEKEAVKEILGFGKWILLSTALMFLATQLDRLMLGKFFSMAFFGIYNIALIFSELPRKIIEKVSGDIIFPLISKFNHLPNDELREKIRSPRSKLLLILAVTLPFFACSGDFIIKILYDERYLNAAWMLPMLAFGMWPLILIATIDRSLISVGKPMYLTLGNLVKVVYMTVAIPLFFHFFSNAGAVLAVVLNDIGMYTVINIALRKEKLSLFWQDMYATVVMLATSAVLIGIRIIAGLGIPGGDVFPGF